MWPKHRKDHLIYREDLKMMKPGAMIIDVACDDGGAVETCRSTTHEDPVYYEEGILHGVLTTNLIYQTPELLERPWYINCDFSKYVAYIIDTLNHDGSINSILNPSKRIQDLVAKYNNGEKID